MTDTTIIDATDVTNTNLSRYRKAYTELLPVIRAVPEEEYLAVNLDAMTIIYTIEGVLPRIAPYRAVIVDELPKFPIHYFDQLEPYALALAHAHTTYCNSIKASPILQALAEKAAPLREILVAEATLLIKRGLLPSNLLDNLQGLHGYRNIATDLLLVADKLRSSFDTLTKRTSLTLAELSDAENLAAEMNHEIGLRQLSPEGQAQAARDRQASYTLVVKSYDQTRAALAYVRRDYDDADEIAPSLYAGRNNGNMKRKELESSSTSTQPAVTQPNDTTVSGVSTTNAAAATSASSSVTTSTPTTATSSAAAGLGTGGSAAKTFGEEGPFV